MRILTLLLRSSPAPLLSAPPPPTTTTIFCTQFALTTRNMCGSLPVPLFSRLPLPKPYPKTLFGRRPPRTQAETAPVASVAAGEDLVVEGLRRTTAETNEEGIAHITPALQAAAYRANPIEFVSAMLCERSRDMGLLEHSLVAEEIAIHELLNRCVSWRHRMRWCVGLPIWLVWARKKRLCDEVILLELVAISCSES